MGYRPLKRGSPVAHTGTKAEGRIVDIDLDRGRALVRWKGEDKAKWVTLAFLERRSYAYSRDAKAVPPPPRVHFGRRFNEVLERQMEKLDLSYVTLAKRSGISRSTIYRMLKDGVERQTVATVEALALALEVSPRDFWTRVERDEKGSADRHRGP